MRNRREGLLFLVVILLEASLAIFLTANQRTTLYNDGFIYPLLQHYFLSGAATSGEIPQWIPSVMQGVPANWWCAVQANLFQAALLPLGGLLKGMGFLSLFYAGILVNTLLLSVGTWLLAGRFFRSPWTHLFVTLAATASATWTTLPWFDFYLFYAAPLILHLLHRFLETGAWRFVFLAGNLFILQIHGNLLYTLPVSTLAVGLYFLFFLLFNASQARESFKRIRWGWAACLTLAGIAAFSLAVYFSFRAGTQDTVLNAHIGRNPDGTVSLGTFLTYGGFANFPRWAWLALGVSPSAIYSIYLGALTLLFVWLGFFFLRRGHLHLLATALVWFLFTEGTVVAQFFYYTWPAMKLYRHVGFSAGFLKLLLCFLAGAGLEGILSGQDPPAASKSTRRLGPCLRWIGTGGLCLALGAFALSRAEALSLKIAEGFLSPEILELFASTVGKQALESCFLRIACLLFFSGIFLVSLSFRGNPRTRALLGWSAAASGAIALALLALSENPGLLQRAAQEIYPPGEVFLPALRVEPWRAAGFFLMACFLLAGMTFRNRLRLRVPWIGLLLLLHVFDLYSYKFSDIVLRTAPREAERAYLAELKPLPFWPRRSLLTDLSHQQATGSSLSSSRRAIEWPVKAFLLGDEPGNFIRIDYWQRPLDQLMRAYWGQPLHDQATKLAGLDTEGGIDFPLMHPAAAKMAGVTEDKIQFFSNAHGVRTEEEAASLMTDKAYAGDLLLIQQDGARAGDLDLAANDRLRLPYRVERFDSNHLEFTVTVPGGKPAWAFYSDVWHPFWKAKVNDKTVPVAKANLAYKAVPISPGENRVHFFFESKALVWAYRFFGTNALIWVVGIVVLAGRIIGAGSPASREARN